MEPIRGLRPNQLVPPLSPRDHVRGGVFAVVELVQYGDYQCPFCGEAESILRTIRDRLGGRLRVAFRNFPLTALHPQALPAAVVAECAGFQDRFWEMHDLLYAHQEALDDRDLLRYAATLDLDAAQLREDLSAARARVREDIQTGEQSGVNGTPTFYVDGQRYDGDWWRAADFLADLERHATRVVEPA